ncbi:MAG: alpha-mannosidase [Anaerolineae bacterium]|nr:alpha-mannosidase [Phycisphaerae bacterium]
MLRHPDYTQTRIKLLVQRLADKIYAERQPITALEVAGPTERISYSQAQELSSFRPSKVGDQFGPQWATYWFRASARVPQEWKGSRVDLLWDSQSEATLWIDGKSVQGLNMTSGDRPDAILLDRAKGGDDLKLQIEMACNRKFGIAPFVGPMPDSPAISPYHLRRCEIARFNPDAWKLYFDALTLYSLYAELAKDGDVSEKSWAGLLLKELNRFCNEIDVDDESTWSAAAKILKDLYNNTNAPRQFEVSAIGHAHIDTAWLWPLAETHRKCERTFSTATNYMRDYPEYRFACSQAYQYDVIKQRNPDLYKRIKDRVKSGQWVIVGGTWIEPDCNIPSGESLCRQFLFGQRYFEREFGVRCKEFWNPDVFGYNGQLPQIMQLSGITRFLTQKLSWNRFNRPQHGTFTWQGVDGSEVLAHFPPADTYNAMTNGPEGHVKWLRDNIKLFKDHDRAHHGVMMFGYGDGGGGPTKDMLEVMHRCEDLQGLPRLKQRSSDEFFELIEKDLTDRPLQVGELYFEYHRGTYTSQSLVKRNNRKAENLLHDLEFLAIAMSPAKSYPRAEINKLWEVLLLNQFHDILPGSSITEVYEDSAAQFRDLFTDGERLAESIAGRGKTLVNTIGVPRREVIEQDGKLQLVAAKPFAAAVLERASSTRANVKHERNRFVLSNQHLNATFDEGGKLVSLVHNSSSRETMAAPGNVFELYDDRPNDFDAWDVDPFHLETRKVSDPAHRASIVRDDPLRVEVRFEYTIGKRSTLTQTVRLDVDSPRLEFHCDIDWQEHQTFLKVAYPINARSMNATYEMQFGNVERPTHYNTSFDLARYEVPLHRWFDFSEHGFGCAILSESKYGGSTFGNTMRLSLLRAPESPDPTCDRGQHQFAWSLMPHVAGWREAGVVAEAMRFNSPLRLVATAPTESFASCDDANLMMDTIKRAEDSDAAIVRLYECHGARGTARLTFNTRFDKATPCNVLEEPTGSPIAPGTSRTIEIAYEPYKVISLRLD